MNKNEAWVAAAAAEGNTESERTVTRLAKKAFLSMWSYANLYTDEGRKNGKGVGKEFCDLLVVFGDHILLFSDKHRRFHDEAEMAVAWKRWYKGSIEDSCNQLAGAEKFIKEHPGRLFLDAHCQHPFPVPLPPPERAVFHLIATMRGSHAAGAKYFGQDSSGTPMLMTNLVGKDHLQNPFQIGYPLESKRFVHILDEMAVDALLSELDTVADLVAYLGAKETYFSSGTSAFVSGEEDLLARYMLKETQGERAIDLIKVPKGEHVVLNEGDWFHYRNSGERIGRRIANKLSYLWDELIERHTGQVQRGVAITGNQLFGNDKYGDEHELVLRAMASENRLSRRLLVGQFLELLHRPISPGQALTKLVSIAPARAYFFMVVSKKADRAYDSYRLLRAEVAQTYAMGYASRFPQFKEIVCVVSDPLDDGGTQDLIYVDVQKPMRPDQIEEIEAQAKRIGILRADTDVMVGYFPASDFPVRHEKHWPGPRVVSNEKELQQALKRRGDARSAAKRRKDKRKGR